MNRLDYIYEALDERLHNIKAELAWLDKAATDPSFPNKMRIDAVTFIRYKELKYLTNLKSKWKRGGLINEIYGG